MTRIAAPILILVLALSACNTAEGFGEDVAATGNAITGAAQDTRDELEE